MLRRANTAQPPRAPKNSRHFTAAPRDFSTRIVSTSASALEGVTCNVRRKNRCPLRAEAVGLRIRLHLYLMKSPGPLFPSGSHCTGTTAGAPLSLIKTTRNFAGWVLLAFRSMT